MASSRRASLSERRTASMRSWIGSPVSEMDLNSNNRCLPARMKRASTANSANFNRGRVPVSYPRSGCQVAELGRGDSVLTTERRAIRVFPRKRPTLRPKLWRQGRSRRKSVKPPDGRQAASRPGARPATRRDDGKGWTFKSVPAALLKPPSLQPQINARVFGQFLRLGRGKSG